MLIPFLFFNWIEIGVFRVDIYLENPETMWRLSKDFYTPRNVNVKSL